MLHVLPAGTPLFHGTHKNSNFIIPAGPAWFAFTEERAAYWGEWSAGDDYVVKRYTSRAVALLDIRQRPDLYRCVTALKPHWDSDDIVKLQGHQIHALGLAGWIGEAEVMLTAPERFVEATKEA